MRWALACTVVAIVLLAGCSGGKGGSGDGTNNTGASAGVLVGKVLDDELRPVSNAVVAVALDNGSAIQTTSGTAGDYRLAALPPGPQRVVTSHIDHEPAERSLLILPGQEKILDIVLTRLASILPTKDTQTFVGAYDCAVAGPLQNGTCDPTGSTAPAPPRQSYGVAPAWGGLLFEVDWLTGTPSAAMNAIRLKVGSFIDNGTFVDVVTTDNPVRVELAKGQIHPSGSVDYAIPPEGGLVWVSVEPGGTLNGGTSGPGVALDLSYELFVTVFVNQGVDPAFTAASPGS